MERIVNYSYRGILKSCNYRCDYCPFAKNASDPAGIRADRDALFRFCHFIETRRAPAGSLQILLLPYGEGMIRPHYAEALARLSRLPAVRRVSCQTNLSWDIDRFAATVGAAGGNLSRISFWCSFHPSCTSLSDFIRQCEALDRYGIRYCAGMVAQPGCETPAEEMRRLLPPRTYMWLNNMEGLRRPYTPEETARFGAIDPFFPLERSAPAADTTDCRGGEDSLFVRADGRTARCPVAGAYTGNLYKNDTLPAAGRCRAARCRCFLAYSNRRTSGLEPFFGRSVFLRIPERIAVKKLFLDIDGTLTGADGRLLPGVEKAAALLSASAALYFATDLPFPHARKKCGSLFPFFRGGIFAGGAHIRLFRPERNHYFYLSAETTGHIDSVLARHSVPERAVKKYAAGGGVYRIAVSGRHPAELARRLADIDGLHIQQENGLITLVSSETDKGKALAWLRRQNAASAPGSGGSRRPAARSYPADLPDPAAPLPVFTIPDGPALALGDSCADIALFREVDYPLAAPGSPAPVRRAALSSMPVALLPVFFGV